MRRVEIMARIYMKDYGNNHVLQNHLGNHKAHLEIDRRINHVYEQKNALCEKSSGENGVMSGIASLTATLAFLGTVAFMVYFLVFALR